jgi:hypothetical protein
MDRYQIAMMSDVKPIAYRFQESTSIVQVKDYMVKCITESVAFDSGNISPSVLEPALIQLSREYKVPIITTNDVEAKVLSMTYKYNRIFSPEKIPENVRDVICYKTDVSQIKEHSVLLAIIGNVNFWM